jgi:hypothetical protein
MERYAAYARRYAMFLARFLAYLDKIEHIKAYAGIEICWNIGERPRLQPVNKDAAVTAALNRTT